MKTTIFVSAMIAAMSIMPVNAAQTAGNTSVELFKTECSACHMIYLPGFLPAASWTNIMSDLGNHFGEDATLDEESKAKIMTYLVENAREKEFKVAKGGKQPIRITKLGWFKRTHRYEVSKRAMKRAGTMSNCVACHRGAENGYFEDD